MAIVTTRWDGMRWTLWRRRDFTPDEDAEAYGEVAWSRRRKAGVKLAGSVPPAMVAQQPTREIAK